MPPIKLFVRQLKADVTRETLRALFEPFGRLVSVHLVMDTKDPTLSRGFGFVVFANEKDGLLAMNETDGSKVNGKAVSVSISLPRNQRGATDADADAGADAAAGGGGDVDDDDDDKEDNDDGAGADGGTRLAPPARPESDKRIWRYVEPEKAFTAAQASLAERSLRELRGASAPHVPRPPPAAAAAAAAADAEEDPEAAWRRRDEEIAQRRAEAERAEKAARRRRGDSRGRDREPEPTERARVRRRSQSRSPHLSGERWSRAESGRGRSAPAPPALASHSARPGGERLDPRTYSGHGYGAPPLAPPLAYAHLPPPPLWAPQQPPPPWPPYAAHPGYHVDARGSDESGYGSPTPLPMPPAYGAPLAYAPPPTWAPRDGGGRDRAPAYGAPPHAAPGHFFTTR